jgi:hypothetical protein
MIKQKKKKIVSYLHINYTFLSILPIVDCHVSLLKKKKKLY